MKRHGILSLSLLLAGIIILSTLHMEARRIKESFKIEKKKKSETKKTSEEITGLEIILDNERQGPFPDTISPDYKRDYAVTFAGYDKEHNSSVESFMLVNSGEKGINGFEVKIDYLDMKGRMLHSRTIKQACFVPPQQTRRFDIKSWDTQHTYYYYLGNTPKRVATPFLVEFTPLKIWIDN